ncbi:MAG: MarR family transcriptional regulator [Actinomycetota bacterium]|nr:MarR family transcriptional regulator [Actinomycetota bacterium]
MVPTAWLRLLRAHSTMTREMDAHLLSRHGLTLSDYEVLLFLSWSSERRLRPVDLAQSVLLSQSGMTRLLNGLEGAGLIERVRSAADGRVVYAALTDSGMEKLRQAATTHVGDIYGLFADRFSADELETLAALLARLPGGDVTPRHDHPVG